MTLFSVITRHWTARPVSFERMKTSLESQSCQDFEHILFTDDVGRGVKWANTVLPELIAQAKGEWVLFLDDDDEYTGPDSLAFIAEAINEFPVMGEVKLGMVMFRGEFGFNGILPPDALFTKKPQRNYVSGQSAAVRWDIANKVRNCWTASYSSDFDYILASWHEAKYVFYLDRVLVKQQRIGKGLSDADFGLVKHE